MDRNLPLLMAALLLAAPLSLTPATHAHEGGIGLPKTQCEDTKEVGVHEYGAPSMGFLIFLARDGAVPPCPYGDATWDGHLEFAFGGAWLQAAASVCTEAYADHAPGAPITVTDTVLSQFGSNVAFSVYTDTLNNDLFQNEPNCGDFESDYGVDCVNQCAPGFPPGLDGTYQVYVSGTTGHIDAGSTGVIRTVCNDGIDNDGDGRTDYPADSGCSHDFDLSEADDPACDDRVDNDGDGRMDYPADPDCRDRYDSDETASPECDDDRDNDGDGAYDWPSDAGCANPWDNSESPTPECNDSLDNDRDGRTDYRSDPDCVGPYDESEGAPPSPECGDGRDNDWDGWTDYPADTGCSGPGDGTESPDPACGDRTDNDGDGRADFPSDPGCSGPYDDSENPDPQCADRLDNDGDGAIDSPADSG